MARMQPASLEEAYGKGWTADDPTPGESRFFLFCRDCLKPDAEFAVWFQPLLFSKEATHKPDFVVYHPAAGLIVAEVKDWRIAEIAEISPTTVEFLDGKSPRTNPLRQVEAHVSALRDRLREAGLVATGAHHGSPLLPISALAVFPYITRHQYEAVKFHQVVPTDRIVFGDELTAAAAGQGKNLLLSKVQERLRFKPPALNARDLTKLDTAIWPSRRIALPVRRGAGKWHFQAEVNHLDALQGRVAYRLEHGHCLLKGGAARARR